MKNRRIKWIALWRVIFLIIPLTACNFPGLVSEGPGGGSGRPLLIVAPPGSTATATPFQPSQSTPAPEDGLEATPAEVKATEILTGTEVADGQGNTWRDYPGPIIWPDIQIPPPMGVLPQPEGQINILLLGSDQRLYEAGLRTDTIILLTLNPSAGTANLTSFPRDTYVYIPGWTVQRINTAYGYGGFEMLALTMEYNFGVHPDYYVLINFWSFVDVVNSLGGINVDVGRTLCDHRNGYGNYCIQAGTRYMDGDTALWYVRSRYSSNDIDRNRRQQEVMTALFARLLSLDGLSRAGELYAIYQDNVTTNMKLEHMTALLPLAAQLSDFSRIHNYYIGFEHLVPWVTYSGAQVLLPIQEAILPVMKQALNSPQ